MTYGTARNALFSEAHSPACYTFRLGRIAKFGLWTLLLGVVLAPLSRGQRTPIQPKATAAAFDTALLRRFEERYHRATSLQATFLERYRENGRVVRVEAGNAYFLRPGKMRWDYEAPEKNTFVVDGKYVWFYTPADHTATRMPAKQSEDWRTPLAFLTSRLKLTQICAKTEPAQGEPPSLEHGVVFRCQVRESRNSTDASAPPALFELSPDGQLNRFVIPQEGGIELEFVFKGWRWNPGLSKQIFQFITPPDAVIVNGLLPEAPGMRQ